jgi:hypothetical protein
MVSVAPIQIMILGMIYGMGFTTLVIFMGVLMGVTIS